MGGGVGGQVQETKGVRLSNTVACTKRTSTHEEIRTVVCIIGYWSINS